MKKQTTISFLSVALATFPLLTLAEKAAVTTRICPPTSAMSKDAVKNTWSSPGGFKSYDISFVTKLTKFLGAQWRGAAVGQVTCVYKGEPKNSFNVLLVYNTLAYEPASNNWGQNLGGYRNCIARKREHCPFNVVVKKKNGDIYKQIEQLKP
jgi:hypothetical protein